MLYYITLLIIFLVIGIGCVILLQKVTYFQTQKKKSQEKESDFINRLYTEADVKFDSSFQFGDVMKDHTVNSEEQKNRVNNELDGNEVRSLVFEIINRMSDQELRRLLKELKERQHKEQREYSRKDFLSIIDYTVEDRHYRDFIRDMSESGVFIKTSQTFSVGQPILMTFMSPDNQKPFRINGEIKHTQEDGIGVKFNIKSQVQELVLKSYIEMIQKG